MKSVGSILSVIITLYSTASLGDPMVQQRIDAAGLQYFQTVGQAVTDFFMSNLPKEEEFKKQKPSYAYAWQNYVINRQPGQIGSAYGAGPDEELHKRLAGTLHEVGRIANAIHNDQSSTALDRTNYANVLVGLIYLATGLEERTGEQENAFRSNLRRSANYPLGISASVMNATDSELVLRFLYSALEGYPVDTLEQVGSTIFFLESKSIEYRQTLAASFFRFTLPQASKPVLFLDSEARLKYSLSKAALEKFEYDMSTSREQLLAANLDAAKSLQSPTLVNESRIAIIENAIAKSKSSTETVRLMSAKFFLSYSIEFWLFAVSILGLLGIFLTFAYIETFRRTTEGENHPRHLRKFLLSFDRTREYFLAQVLIAFLGFALGIYLTKVDAIATLF